MLGFSSEEKFQRQNPLKDFLLKEGQLNQLLGGNRVVAKILRNKSESIWVEYSLRKIPDPEGRLSVYVIARDITSQKRNKDRLVKRGKTLHALNNIQKMLLDFQDGQDIFTKIMGELGTAAETDRAFMFEIISNPQGDAHLHFKAE